MSEFDEKLNALLSNPDSMAQIMQFAQTLSGSAPSGSPAPEPSAAPPPSSGASRPGEPPPPFGTSRPGQSAPPPERQPPPPTGDLLSSLAGGIDPKLLAKLLPLVQELNSGQDSNARQLLYALRPYLKPERQERVERALQLARLIHLGKKFLAGWEG